MRITTASVLVDDQEKALRFYTDILGFEKKTDIPTGEHRWLTVVSPEAPDAVELLLEPDDHPAARPFKEALVADGIPYTSFGVADAQQGIRATPRGGRALRPGAHGHGTGRDRRPRRHLRQPDPDREHDRRRLSLYRPGMDIIGIVGAGTMGAGIAQVCVEHGHEVVLHDVDEAAVERGRERIRDGLSRRAAKLDLDPDSIDDWVDGRIESVRQAETLAMLATESDVVIEAAFEDLRPQAGDLPGTGRGRGP